MTGRSLTRRGFLVRAGLGGLGAMGYGTVASALAVPGGSLLSFGPPRSDPAGILDLPAGFRYVVVSRTGDVMSDGLRVPGRPDGMGCFAGAEGLTLLVRNHELNPGTEPGLSERAGSLLYDAGDGTMQDGASVFAIGGTTTLAYDTRKQRLVRQHRSLAGTLRNCSGGTTPWGTWISCEETTLAPGFWNGAAVGRPHGFNFEVRATGSSLVHAEPLVAMGRFRHEAVAVDPRTGIAYQTEDLPDGLVYRFVPAEPGRFAAGGRLEALALVGMDGVATGNRDGPRFDPSRRHAVRWVSLDDPESPRDDLRHRGRAAGAAIFVNGEGIVVCQDSIVFAASGGGETKHGQIWRYRPAVDEGTPGEDRLPGTLELLAESGGSRVLDQADAVVALPSGALLLAEDGERQSRIVAYGSADGFRPFAVNVLNDSELTGLAFSPDASTLFVNIQEPGLTLAISGPWTG